MFTKGYGSSRNFSGFLARRIHKWECLKTQLLGREAVVGSGSDFLDGAKIEECVAWYPPYHMFRVSGEVYVGS